MHRSNSRRAALGSFLSDFSPLDKKARQLLRGRRRTADAVRAWAETLEIRTLLSADLAVTMTGPAGNVPMGGQAFYQLTLVNNGPDDAADVSLKAFNDFFLPFDQPIVRQISAPGFNGPTDGSVQQISLLPAGAQASFQVVQNIPGGQFFPASITFTGFSESASVTSSTPDSTA